MTTQEFIRAAIKRLVWITIISTALVWIGSEAFYAARPEDTDREPRQIELVIPEGTSEQVARGEAAPSIPTEMVFVTGDLLIVRNQDTVDHQLGPMWIPAQSSAILPIEAEEDYVVSCSFQPSRYLGFEIRPATTLNTRITALLLAAPPTALFFFLYSFVLFPIKPKGGSNKPGSEKKEISESYTLPAEREEK